MVVSWPSLTLSFRTAASSLTWVSRSCGRLLSHSESVTLVFITGEPFIVMADSSRLSSRTLFGGGVGFLSKPCAMMHLKHRPCLVIQCHYSSMTCHYITSINCWGTLICQRAFLTPILLVAGRRPLHAGESKVSLPAAEPRALPVFELATGAEPLHLQPVQEEGQAEREAAVSPWDEAESLWREVGAGRSLLKRQFKFARLIKAVISYVVDRGPEHQQNSRKRNRSSWRWPPSWSMPLYTHRFSPPQCCWNTLTSSLMRFRSGERRTDLPKYTMLMDTRLWCTELLISGVS